MCTHGRSAAAEYSANAAVSARAAPFVRSAPPRPIAAIACSAASASASTSLSFAFRATTAEIASAAPCSNASCAAAAQPVLGGVDFFTSDEIEYAARLFGGVRVRDRARRIGDVSVETERRTRVRARRGSDHAPLEIRMLADAVHQLAQLAHSSRKSRGRECVVQRASRVRTNSTTTISLSFALSPSLSRPPRKRDARDARRIINNCDLPVRLTSSNAAASLTRFADSPSPSRLTP